MLAEDAAPTGRLTADDHTGCHCKAAFQPQWRLRLGVVRAAARHLQLALQLRRGLGLRSYYIQYCFAYIDATRRKRRSTCQSNGSQLGSIG